MTLIDALNDPNLDDIIDSMTVYANDRIRNIDVKHLQGKQGYDFVAEIFQKVITGVRNWENAKCTFKEFLFGCLKSHLNSFFNGLDFNFQSDMPEIKSVDRINNPELINVAIKILKNQGADEEEIDIFECWIDGIIKPAEIADLLEKDVGVIYNGIKRLSRRMPELKTYFKSNL